jgi:hypothetical protein
MNPKDCFTKNAQPRRLSVREAVTLHGDHWRHYVGKEHSSQSDLVTQDGLEKLDMTLMEKGISPRIRPLDLVGL